MENIKIKDVFDQASNWNDKGEFGKAILLLNTLLDQTDSSDSSISATIISNIGLNYLDAEDFDKALACFENALVLHPSLEIGSLGRYLVLKEMDRDEDSIKEMLRYLEENTANLYKTTLEELLEGLEKGYMTAFKEDIERTAKLNQVF